MKYKFLTNEAPRTKNLIKEIWKIGMPIALQSVVMASVQLIDNLFLGHLKNATYVASGVNAINNMSFNISMIIGGFMAGIGIYFAQASGSKDKNIQHEIFKSKFFWTIILATITVTIAVIFLKPISSLWISNKNPALAIKAQGYARDYGNIIFFSIFISFITMIFSSSFKENKMTKQAMYFALIAIVINASLNYPLMYTTGWGVKGSAIATIIARSIELLIWLIYLKIKKPNFFPSLKIFFIFNMYYIWKVVPKSFWWMCNSILLSIAFTLQIMLISKTSLEAGASLNAAGVIAQLVMAFTGGYSVAISILFMHRIAQHKQKNLAEYISKNIKISFFFGIISGLVLASISWTPLVLYPKYTHNANYQSVLMLLAIASLFPFNLSSGSMVSFIKGGGYSKIVITIDAMFSWVVILPTTYLLTNTSLGNNISYGFIYWIVCATGVLKFPILYLFIKKRWTTFKPVL